MTGAESRFANGPFAGQTLAEAWPSMPQEWIGTAARDSMFPLLVKFIFTEDKLSVQVHPDDAYAAQHEQAAGGRGKTEMWYALRARAGAEVMVGLNADVTPRSFQSAIENQTAENCLRHVSLSEGDVVFVPARTVHTIGSGLALCEIQEHSDLTYRVYDYNRRDAQGHTRPLHIEKALAVMRFGPQLGGKVEPVTIRRDKLTITFMVACQYFATEKWEFAGKIEAKSSREHFDLLLMLDGSGQIQFGGEQVAYRPAEVWMIPAALGKFEVLPNSQTSLLRTYVPASLDAVRRELAAAGVREADISRVVHT
jgi:mannose-6-phosphate isomerase